MTKIQTIERFIFEQQPHTAHGEFTNLLYDIALAAKLIAYKTNRAGLVDILGRVGTSNIQGEAQQKLDVFADELIVQICDHTGRICVMASEEREDIITIPEKHRGAYALVFDPLDGSSNIDVNVSIGTIFGIYRCVDYDLRGRVEDVLQPARNLVAAGYILFGASTMMVYSTGNGVHGFTLDLEIGEFLLSHKNMTLPSLPAYYSVNHAYFDSWLPSVQDFVRWLQGQDESDAPVMSTRYIGSLVADFHRNLLRGGIFFYPAERGKPDGKIRLLYEAGPLAFLIEQAGGYASNGRQPILDIMPTDLHQRVPFYIGNRFLVEKAEHFLRQDK